MLLGYQPNLTIMRKVTLTAVLLLSFFVSSAQTTLKINEFMANNNSTIQDETNEYDDWIEVINPTSNPINIAGYFFTDDFANPTLWQIPTNDSAATEIPSNGYMLFWADWDTLVSIYHINMKLAAGGEMIGLYTADTVLVDSITFGQQMPDICYHRCIDGSGGWETGQPSPNASNFCDFSISKYEGTPFSIYPNPTNEHIRIQLGDATTTNFSVQITDQLGRIVMELPSLPSSKIDISHLYQGIYTIHLIDVDGNRSTQVFIKN